MPATTRGDAMMVGRPDLVGGHFHVQKKIGEGSFGVIYQGFNDLNDRLVAIKFEPVKAAAPQLKDEYRTYKLLLGKPGIPTIHYFGVEGNFNCLVMELLGPSLEEVFDRCGRRFSPGTVAMIAIEMISRVQMIHDEHLIYRDIKPDNFLLGPKDGTIYVVDFGMAKNYWNPLTQTHIPYSEKKSLSGTARYMSINTHKGREQSRRDDLEALGHVFLYFLRGSLPWQGIKANTNKEKYEKIGERKERVLIPELCAGFPEEFARYMEYVRSLGFEEKPKYETLKGLFRTLLAKLGPEASVPDWDKKGICVERGATMFSVKNTATGANVAKMEELDSIPASGVQSSPRTPREQQQQHRATSPITFEAVNAQDVEEAVIVVAAAAKEKPPTTQQQPKVEAAPVAVAGGVTTVAVATVGDEETTVRHKKTSLLRRLFCI